MPPGRPTRSRFERRVRAGAEVLLQFSIAYLSFYKSLIYINMDHVAFMHRRNWAAQRGFWRDVAQHKTMAGSAETSICNQGNGATQAFADNSSRHAQHLAHPWATLGALIADNYHVAGLDLL